MMEDGERMASIERASEMKMSCKGSISWRATAADIDADKVSEVAKER
jgi:hypothetical protein